MTVHALHLQSHPPAQALASDQQLHLQSHRPAQALASDQHGHVEKRRLRHQLSYRQRRYVCYTDHLSVSIM